MTRETLSFLSAAGKKLSGSRNPVELYKSEVKYFPVQLTDLSLIFSSCVKELEAKKL